LSGEAGHFGDDRFFLTAIQTQGLLLLNVSWARKTWLATRWVSATRLSGTTCAVLCQRDRHLRWLVD